MKSLFALLFVFTTAVHAAPKKLQVDTTASTIKWVGSKVVGKHNGSIKLKSGEVTFDKDVPQAGVFTIDMNTIADEDLKDPNDNAKLVGHLKSDDFFGAAKYPTAEFKITKTELKGTDRMITGNLTMKGISKPITFPVKIMQDKTGYSAKGAFKINRTEWGLKYNSGKFFDVKKLGDKMINDDIELEIDLKTTGV